MIKETFLSGADFLFKSFSNIHEIMSAIQDLQLSDNTVTKTIHAISNDMQIQRIYETE